MEIRKAIFLEFLKLHIYGNLPVCCEYLKLNKKGELVGDFNELRISTTENGFTSKKVPLAEGKENPIYHGGFVLCDHDQLIPELMKNHAVIGDPKKVYNLSELKRQIGNYWGSDGGLVLDTVNHEISLVREIQCNISRPSIDTLIPKDFINLKGNEEPTWEKIGGRTSVNMLIPRMYPNINAVGFIIKESAYGPLQIGKVVNFDRGGIRQELYFKYDPNTKSPLKAIDGIKGGIIGIYIAYNPSEFGPVPVSRTVVDGLNINRLEDIVI